ncbi:uncharacterized protein [Halyomorpha halys]|uniref:uncharacterized protein isoform X2 n=1 Tax=Halyomorpha halys TaxID=286706 RepID=UPI0006D4FD56|nr:uncharacterized protein LOC106687613 isoform X2 [Halyomorpha halys]
MPPWSQTDWKGMQTSNDAMMKRWPENRYEQPPQNIVETTNDQECPEGYKKARGQCSKLTERELELDRLPKEPCPPGQRRSRLVCRDYYE